MRIDAMGDAIDLLLEELKDEIKCEICWQSMKISKVLQCMHLFCQQCLAMTLIKGNKILVCPKCRGETVVKNGDPKLLPTAFVVNRISEILSRYENQCNSMEKHDQVCKTGEKLEASAALCCETQDQMQPLQKAAKPICQAQRRDDALYRQFYQRNQRSVSIPTAEEAQLPQYDNARRNTHPVHYPTTRLVSLSTTKDKGFTFDVSLAKTIRCTNEVHTYKVELDSIEYMLKEDVELDVWKFCDNSSKCNAWADDINATSTDQLGNIHYFSKKRVNDGDWLLSWRAKYEGNFTITVKADEKKIFESNVKVVSNLTTPIEV